MALTCCDFQKAQTSELLKILIPRSRFAGPAGHGQVRGALATTRCAYKNAHGTPMRRQQIEREPVWKAGVPTSARSEARRSTSYTPACRSTARKVWSEWHRGPRTQSLALTFADAELEARFERWFEASTASWDLAGSWALVAVAATWALGQWRLFGAMLAS